MATHSIPPLRVQKGSNGLSPNKSPFGQNRPLSELSPMALRRNSPSFPRGSMIKNDSSPATSSPFGAGSPRLFWKGRDPTSPGCENESPSSNGGTSPSKRSSIENLKKASRVKNSSMFAKEQENKYDPSKLTILDGRPLSTSVQSSAFGDQSLDDLHSEDDHSSKDESLLLEGRQSFSNSRDSDDANTVVALSPSKSNLSPTKSSLSKRTRNSARGSSFDPETGIWADTDVDDKQLPEGRRLHRRGKSVTFDQGPPQINEYEMTTPVPSSVASGSREGSYESATEDDDEEDGEYDHEYGYARGLSADHDDSFDASLEDTDKTPVVLPEDWRFMSPDNASTELTNREEDVFEDEYGSPEPTAHPGALMYRPQQTSLNSVDSNGQTRPLPPLPPQMGAAQHAHGSRDSLSGTLERISSRPRGLHSPLQAASWSKSDIRRMSGGSLSLEDRLRLMVLKEQEQQKPEAEVQRERRMRRATSKEISPAPDGARIPSNTVLPNVEREETPRISRDSILAQLRGTHAGEESDEPRARSYAHGFDPDVPIPSLEDPTQHQLQDQIVVKEEELDDIDLYAIPNAYARKSDSEVSADDEATSQYSQASMVLEMVGHHENMSAVSLIEAISIHSSKQVPSERISLPDFADFGGQSNFDFGLSSYMTPPLEKDIHNKIIEQQEMNEEGLGLPDLAVVREKIQHRFSFGSEGSLELPKPAFAEEESEEDPGTPTSVVRHPVSASVSPDWSESQGSTSSIMQTPEFRPTPPAKDSPVPEEKDVAPEPVLESAPEESVPEELVTEEAVTEESGPTESKDAASTRTWEKRVSSLVPLKFSCDDISDDMFSGLEQEFDRVVETQKRGYLMRQNTKIVIASERDSQDESRPKPEDLLPRPPAEPNAVVASPRNISQPTWTAEPWNGKSRRKSIRTGGEKIKRKPVEGSVPPLPGQPSNVEGLTAVTEDELAEEEAEELDDGAERGRLFVKVIGVKDLHLPLAQNEQSKFAMTLDNGLHCVTTAWLDLSKNAPVGQEFELVVLNELEFQLTLQMKLEPPKVQRPQSPTKPPPSPKKQTALGRLFGSPRKRKESDARAQQEALAVKAPVGPPSAYELVQGLVGKDGSFARAYVALSEHEKEAYGRPYTVDIKCFNEWAMEEVSVGSSRSKKSVTQLQRRPPYEIGKLQLQLLYVPKPKGAKDEDMPKSMNSAIRTLRDAEEKMKHQADVIEFEGYLSQQGGDCPFWRRRFFKLVGSKFTAYHETTLQPRATINLGKASRLIDDKMALTQKEISTKGGGRRKSAFADDEEGYMFVEEGFRIRFANGEVIDFYADTTEHKEEWMKVLGQVVGKGSSAASSSAIKGWAEMVLKRENNSKARTSQPLPPSTPSSTFGSSGIPRLSRPQSYATSESYHPEGGSRSQANSPVKPKTSREERQQKARSMMA